jgi:hypothetical protein
MNLTQPVILDRFNALVAVQDFSNKYYQYKNQKYIGDVIVIIYNSEFPPKKINELGGTTGFLRSKNNEKTPFKYLIFESNAYEIETLVEILGDVMDKIDILSITIENDIEGMLSVTLNGDGI